MVCDCDQFRAGEASTSGEAAIECCSGDSGCSCDPASVGVLGLDLGLDGSGDLHIECFHVEKSSIQLGTLQACNFRKFSPVWVFFVPKWGIVFRMDIEDGAEIRTRLGAEIRAARARRGYSQAELADLSGISRSAILRFESGERSIDIVRLFALAEALRVSPGSLLDAAQKDD